MTSKKATIIIINKAHFREKIIHRTNLNNRIFKIEEHRRKVATLVVKCLTQTEIARQLGVDQSTISDDIAALKKMSREFIFDPARSDLANFYKSCLDDISEAKKEAWTMYETWNTTPNLSNAKYRLKALQIAIQAEEAKFKLLTEGPNVLAVKSVNDSKKN